jgi:hypothetical protein
MQSPLNANKFSGHQNQNKTGYINQSQHKNQQELRKILQYSTHEALYLCPCIIEQNPVFETVFLNRKQDNG